MGNRRTHTTVPTAPPAISVHNVSKTFGARSRSPVHALKNVSFSVEEKGIVGLIGPNGAGKTTLLRILLGYLEPDSGAVSLFGSLSESLAVRSSLGYQADSQFRSKRVRVREFLELHAALLGLADDGSISSLLRTFHLMAYQHRSLADLSKGLRQKVELVLAFLGTPRLVFLDEPTASLDPPSVFELRDFLLDRKQSNATIFFSSHNLSEVEHVCDRVLFINEGRLVGDYVMSGRRRGFLEKKFRDHLVDRREQ